MLISCITYKSAIFIFQLQLDIAEIQSLLKTASRQKVKEILSIEESKLKLQLSELLKNEKQNAQSTTSSTAGATAKYYQVTLRNYGKCWIFTIQ